MATEPAKAVYANVLNVTAGPFDIVLDFGFQPPESMQRKSPDYEIVSRVAMSLAHAKTMLPILARVIAEYEEKVGPITAPGFEQFGKE